MVSTSSAYTAMEVSISRVRISCRRSFNSRARYWASEDSPFGRAESTILIYATPMPTVARYRSLNAAASMPCFSAQTTTWPRARMSAWLHSA